MTWSVILGAVGSFLAKLGAGIYALLVAKEAGRVSAENEALQEQNERVQQAHQAEIDAEDPTKPDPFLRD